MTFDGSTDDRTGRVAGAGGAEPPEDTDEPETAERHESAEPDESADAGEPAAGEAPDSPSQDGDSDAGIAEPTTNGKAAADSTPRPMPTPMPAPAIPAAEPRPDDAEPEPPPAPARVARLRFSLHRRMRVVSAIAVAVALALTAAGALAFAALLDAREALVDRADPGLQASSDLLAAVVDQETGVRAYVLSDDEAFLDPYELGAEVAGDARDRLDRLTADLPGIDERLAEVDRSIAAWRDGYADPTIAAVRAGDRSVREEASLREGRDLFDSVRAEIGELQDELTAARIDARDRLNGSTVRLLAILAIAALIVAAMAALLWLLVRRTVEAPLQELGRDAQQVADGDLDHLIEPVGPDELQALAVAMERMRQRIVDELAAVRQARDALERQTGDLERSNAELEQFAYVASHDLQEPLRKVASFCQLLQTRYAGQLDERADQYIDFAVDGAKRMQALINDLLAFSRVGRTPGTGDAVVVRTGQLVDEALENLSEKIQESGAEITVVGPLPRVRIETSLGVALFQNLISNGLKFHRPGTPPSVHVGVRRSAGFHEFRVTDEGIGIPPEYAERIFALFQRLHARDDYGGTGIGLAMCRKIVEGHGGRIWIDTDAHAGGAPGTTVRFTLPVVEGDA